MTERNMKQSVAKLSEFLLEQQLPDTKGVVHKDPQAPASTLTDFMPITANDHVTQVALERCHCIHLQEYLPHLLDLELCKAKNHPRGWVVANPVHALHLESQLEDDPPVSTSTNSKRPPTPPPLLYGEEQQRTLALSTEGVTEHWCPLDGRSAIIQVDTAIEKKETVVTHHPRNPRKSAQSVTTANGGGKIASASPHIPPASPPIKPLLPSSSPSASAASRPMGSPSVGSTSLPAPAIMPLLSPPAVKSCTTSTESPMQLQQTPPLQPLVLPEGSLSSLIISTSPSSASNKPPPIVTSSTPAASTALENGTNAPPISTLQSAAKCTTGDISTHGPSAPATTTNDNPLVPPAQTLSDLRYHHLRLEEDKIRLIRRSLSSQRFKKKAGTSKKRKLRESDIYKSPGLPGWRQPTTKEYTTQEQQDWSDAALAARSKVELWMENYRVSRQSFLAEREHSATTGIASRPQQPSRSPSFFLPEGHNHSMRCCQLCANQKPRRDKTNGDDGEKNIPRKKKPRAPLVGDELMQCLECSFIGCAPQSTAPQSKQHILRHLLLSGHTFAVSCGERAQLFCFKCGDFVNHPIFEQEKRRLDLSAKVPWMAWKEYTVQRSFDPFQFIRTQEHGIVWRGPVATYPPLVPKEHVRASQLSLWRQALFSGGIHEKWLVTRPAALAFSASQSLMSDNDRFRIAAPVGMFNLGNTCFQSAILQCLIHCQPLQRYFMNQCGHHHLSCTVYREQIAAKLKKEASLIKTEGTPRPVPSTEGTPRPVPSICLACEMDRLFLMYYGSTVGKDIIGAMAEAAKPPLAKKDNAANDLFEEKTVVKGDPLILSDMLTAAWKSGGMDYLAGYDQRDAHEFLNSFLDLVGKHSRLHRDRVYTSINTAKPDNSLVPKKEKAENDIIKQLFEGTLRSVLVCQECGGKRTQREPFVNVSLTLSEEVERLEAENGNNDSKIRISVETCLEHFILPEKLGDSVQCPSCKKKTPHQKQHTFSKLPKVLCLHLKRFDAARNRKIDEFVSFPAKGLNMGPLLSHWCEVTSVPSTVLENSKSATSQILYDLYGTVNHIGTLQSGHYVSNVKVEDLWYHCNDAHVSRAGLDDGEKEVVDNEGAYVLFYIRR